jgi:tetratricopeptide (TPR) repeat protein
VPPPVAPTVEPPAETATGDGLSRGTSEPADQELALGDSAYEAEKYKEARAHFRKAEQLAPKDPAPKIGLVRVAVAEADLPLDYASAPHDARIPALLKQLDAALKLDPEYGLGLLERGHLLLIQGKAEQASGALERAAQLLPRHAEAQSAVGVALIAVGRTKDSVQYFEHAAALDRDNPDRLGNLGAAYLLQGRTPDAVAAFEKAARLAPNNARYQSDLGTAYLAENRLDRALPALTRAVDLEPRASYLTNLSYAQQLGGDYDRAVATAERAAQLDPKLGSAWLNLGTARAKRGELDQAEAAFKRAQALDPEDPRVKANLEELLELRKKKSGAP